MTESVSAVDRPGPAVVDGVDVDAVAAAVRSCPGVDDLLAGSSAVATYLPGRRVRGVRVASDHVLIAVRGRWAVPVAELAWQVRSAVAGLVAPRRVDIIVADLTDAAAEVPVGIPAAGPQDDEVIQWTTSSAGDAPGGSSSASITPTTAAIPPPSPPV